MKDSVNRTYAGYVIWTEMDSGSSGWGENVKGREELQRTGNGRHTSY